ncbi:pirin family protein [Terracoccus luteus]|uniref:Pirin n=1 Tax=Terracoccus luteus TaxID=53356 RepID=A0A839PW68_9MICO|nr:pirin family protein [Terracoccus luteus]MBB2988488.1 hypothetical protein [Terracoccus luteus]MCP2174123.1 hypothetical protein [Terracoccus luteus]
MSNPERRPGEVMGEARPASAIEVMTPREVPLGGPRAMTVRRTLPQRQRSLIGAWCFLDHYGPDDVASTGGMRVPGHPHTGLQTVSWLFTGEVEHRDTTGVHAMVRPGELNLMTAGSGIAHSEFSTPSTSVLHGAQLWLALPDATRHVAPTFEHYAPPAVERPGATARVFLGALLGSRSPVVTHSPLLGAEIVLDAGASLTLDAPAGLQPGFEHGLLVDIGGVTLGGGAGAGNEGVAVGESVAVERGELAYLPVGLGEVTITATDDEPARVLLLGGEPFGEQIVMWWNFIGRTHDEVVAYREAWEREREAAGDVDGVDGVDGVNGADGALGGGEDPGSRYGPFPDAWDSTLPAPPMPPLRLRSRG